MSKDDPDLDLLFVDEAQDLSPLQWDLVEKWSGSVPLVIIAGDDDQSIYAWGGADPHGMDTFSKKHRSEVEVLDQSHRIPKQVHRLAESIISRLGDRRVTKNYRPSEHEGKVRFHGSVWSLGPVLDDASPDTLVLYRNHSLRREVEDFLLTKGIPYYVQSGYPGVLQGRHGKAAMLWQMISDEWAEFNTIITPVAKLKPLLSVARTQIQSAIKGNDISEHYLRGWHKVLDMPNRDRRYLLMLEKRQHLRDIKPTIRLSTIHGAKGQEADNVVLLNAMTNRTWEAMNTDPDSEIRTWYVGVTRTRKNLDIVTGENPVPYLTGGAL